MCLELAILFQREDVWLLLGNRISMFFLCLFTAYMAPEVFTKNNTVGHGRAVDIWSLGCVLVEMASGQRPWAEYDSNYQIMFKVGMGETPHVPDSLSDEGHSFANLCLQHCPKDRATTTELSQHLFLKVWIY